MTEIAVSLLGVGPETAHFSAGDESDDADLLRFRFPETDEAAFVAEDVLLSVFGAALRRRVARAADGAGVAPVSISCELAAPPSTGDLISIETNIDRRTRTIAFVSAEARGSEGDVAATATGVFRIVA